METKKATAAASENPQKAKKKIKISNRAVTIILIVILVVGLGVLLYPTIANWWNERTMSRAVATYNEAVSNLTEKDYTEIFAAAEAYNEEIYQIGSATALVFPERIEGYDDLLDVAGNGVMGYITIDRINVELPIYHGTEDSVQIVDKMFEFSEPKTYYPNRYSQDNPEKSTALDDAVYNFCKINDVSLFALLDGTGGLNNFLEGANVPTLFDIIELQYEALSGQEKPEFQSGVNTVLNSGDLPWILHDGRMIKIDAGQFEQDLKQKALEKMKILIDSEPVFQTAYGELVRAMEFLSEGNFAEAVVNAGKSYESILKILGKTDKGSADVLTGQITAENGLLDLPDSMSCSGFREKVLMSLPFIRNHSAAHGSGAADDTISHALANLAVNLACALDTYLVEEYRQNIC